MEGQSPPPGDMEANDFFSHIQCMKTFFTTAIVHVIYTLQYKKHMYYSFSNVHKLHACPLLSLRLQTQATFQMSEQACGGNWENGGVEKTGSELSAFGENPKPCPKPAGPQAH